MGGDPEHAHPGVVLWSWMTGYLNRDRLPRRRVLIRFEFPTVYGQGARGWVLLERGDAEICEKNPGFEEDLVVTVNDPLVVTVNDPMAFARWHLGELEWGDALRSRAGPTAHNFTIYVRRPPERTACRTALAPIWLQSRRSTS